MLPTVDLIVFGIIVIALVALGQPVWAKLTRAGSIVMKTGDNDSSEPPR